MTPAAAAPSPVSAENRSAATAFAGVTQQLRGRRVKQPAAERVAFGLPIMAMLIVMGLTTLAACVLIPLREERRQQQHALDELLAERDYLSQQAATNAAFVARVHTDPALAERLTMRYTRRPADGKQFLDDVGGTASGTNFDASPYSITQIAPPPPREAYRTDLPPMLAKLIDDTKSRLILMGGALFLIASAVILGRDGERESDLARVPNP